MPKPRPPIPPMSDTEMIDFLQQLLKLEPHALLLHVDWQGQFLTPGLGLMGGKRTLRQAIAQCAGRFVDV